MDMTRPQSLCFCHVRSRHVGLVAHVLELDDQTR